MTTPYGQQPPGQQPPPGPPPGDGLQSPQPQQPFGQQPSGEQPSPFGQQPQQPVPGDQPSPFGQQPAPGDQPSPFGQQTQSSPFGQQPQQPSQPFGAQPQSPFGQQPGQPSPFGQQGQPSPFGQAAQFGPRTDYAHWGLRAAGSLIDFAPIFVLPIIGAIIAANANSLIGGIISAVGYLAGIGWTVYNRWIKMGTTGQSLGKKMVKIKLVRESDGQPIGPLMAFVRDLCHNLDGWVCGLGYLWPLWDEKKQTFADKILNTVVVPGEADAAPASAPFGQAPGFPAPPSPSPSFPAPPAPFGQQQQQPFGAPPQQSPFGQQPQQPQPFGQQPQGTAAPSPESQPVPALGEAEPTQVLRPGQQPQQAPSGFDEAEPTQKITPEQLRQQLPGADGPNGPGTPQQ
ncbi:RDD family protein [Amycolatopsis sp. NPDC049868]|uniref:RDD family protein n=1 Tax=Amycolatopsis sp. NPDC049868 TaxID=3363934 RepID=UPI0037B1F137